MLTLKTAVWTGLVLGLVALAISWLSWSHLPEPMVIHWDARGQPNGWGPRVLGAFLLPALIVLFGLLFALLRRISPQGFRLEGFEDTVALVAIALQGFLLVVHVITLRAARTGGSLEPSVMLLGLGALTAVLGNRMGKMRRNFFIGIRTPWTLSDPEVWLRTHRLGGKVFFIAGLGTMVCALLPYGLVGAVPLLLAAGLVPTVYSYVIYKRLHPGARA